MKKVLFIMDPLERLTPLWDTSLYLLKELTLRGYECWVCDIKDIRYETPRVYVRAKRMRVLSNHRFKTAQNVTHAADKFGLILIRKEPPFDMNYYYLTILLELVNNHTPIVNHPRGIRNTNEKLSVLHFLNLSPNTVITQNGEDILKFQKKIKSSIVLKPLDQKGGKDVRWIKNRYSKSIKQYLPRNTFMGAQKFIRSSGGAADKRILLLDGRFLSAYEKRPAKNDFRGNLSLGATFHPTTLSAMDKKIISRLKPFLKKEGLSFVGLDVLEGKLIDINVTCPAGIPESQILYPKLEPVKVWADYLEGLAFS